MLRRTSCARAVVRKTSMEDWVQSDSREDPADHVSLTQDEEVASRVQELMEGDLPLEGRADPTSLAHREAETERERDKKHATGAQSAARGSVCPAADPLLPCRHHHHHRRRPCISRSLTVSRSSCCCGHLAPSHPLLLQLSLPSLPSSPSLLSSSSSSSSSSSQLLPPYGVKDGVVVQSVTDSRSLADLTLPRVCVCVLARGTRTTHTQEDQGASAGADQSRLDPSPADVVSSRAAA